MSGWIVWPEWDEGDDWPVAEGSHWFIEAETEEEAKQLWRDSAKGCRVDWLAAEPADAPTRLASRLFPPKEQPETDPEEKK